MWSISRILEGAILTEQHTRLRGRERFSASYIWALIAHFPILDVMNRYNLASGNRGASSYHLRRQVAGLTMDNGNEDCGSALFRGLRTPSAKRELRQEQQALVKRYNEKGK